MRNLNQYFWETKQEVQSWTGYSWGTLLSSKENEERRQKNYSTMKDVKIFTREVPQNVFGDQRRAEGRWG